MKSDIEIAQKATLVPVTEIAKSLGLNRTISTPTASTRPRSTPTSWNV